MSTVFLSYSKNPGQGDMNVEPFGERLRAELVLASGRQDITVHRDLHRLAPELGLGHAVRLAVRLGAVMVPLITPAFLEDERCRAEVRTFERLIRESGFLNRIVPVVWVATPAFYRPEADEVALILNARKAFDYTEMRFESEEHPGQRRTLANIAAAVLGCFERQLDAPAAEPAKTAGPQDIAEQNQALAQLLDRMYTARELRLLLLRMDDGDTMAMGLDSHGPMTRQQMVLHLVELLRRFDRIDAAFFHQLRRARPMRAVEINQVAARFGC